MSDEILHIRADNFRANILLERLPDLPLPKYRKLVRLMSCHSQDNRGAGTAGPMGHKV